MTVPLGGKECMMQYGKAKCFWIYYRYDHLIRLESLIYSKTHKYCNQNSSSSSTGFQHSFDNTIVSPSPSGTGAGVLVAIFMSPTVVFLPKLP